ncbi:MAG TPA: DUF4160 domain-containing protein [Solibacterales bacterium]|nr:DUF4160 domain-containing protein [Bryobacterales bacterium]
MPTALKSGPYRFFFFSGDRREPAHVHVECQDAYAKVWLEPVSVARAHGFRSHQLSEISRIVREHRQSLLDRWHEHFGNPPGPLGR